MEPLWAPWRSEFILREKKEEGCFFCRYLLAGPGHDRENLVVERGEQVFVVMNRFPYNNGHLLIAPHRHTADLGSLDDHAAVEMWRTAERWVARIRRAMKAEGVNLGLNLGRAAGAGVEDHLHLHVVPRWVGDTNFMPVCSDAKVISQSLAACYEALRAAMP